MVEGAVVDRAHGYAVRDYRLATVAVRQDVRRLQQLAVAQPTDGTACFVGDQYTLPEQGLVQPYSGNSLGVAALRCSIENVGVIPTIEFVVVQRDHELLSEGLLVG